MNANTIGYGMGTDSTNLDGYNTITGIKSDQATTNSTYSYFTQWTLHLPNDFSITAGEGISTMNIQLEDRLWGLSNNHPGNTKQKVYETSYRNLFSPNISVNKKISEIASVYASYSIAYKAPVSSNILISTTGKLNTSLKPERGEQIEIGTKGSMLENRLFYTMALFHAEFKDKFTVQTFQNPANTVTLYSYIVNGGELKNNGLEILVKYNLMKSKNGFFKSLSPFANLTYSDFKYGHFTYEKIGKDINNMDSTIIADYTGNTIAGVAPLVYNIGIDFETKIGLYGTLNYHYRSSMFYTSDGLNETNPFYLLNTKIGFKKSVNHFEFDIYAGSNNMTGSQYYQMVFVNQLPDAFIPGPDEINFFGGINIKYNF